MLFLSIFTILTMMSVLLRDGGSIVRFETSTIPSGNGVDHWLSERGDLLMCFDP